jgi:hypothetical protein
MATFDLSALLNANGEVDENHSDLEIGLIDPDPTQAPGDVKISTNVRIKSLKRRTLTVNVYPITSAVPGRPDASPVPQLTQAEIQNYFDRVYLAQANLKCQIVLKPTVVIAWDTTTSGDFTLPFSPLENSPISGDLYFDLQDGADTPEVTSVISGMTLPNNEIHVFLLGGCDSVRQLTPVATGAIVTSEEGLNGYADIANRRCFVAANKFVPNPHLPPHLLDIPKKELLNTITHEVGHVLIVHGHPDQYNAGLENPSAPYSHNGGVAPLAMDPFLHQRRLMASGFIRSQGIELVLEEWKQIAIEGDKTNNTPSGNGN